MGSIQGPYLTNGVGAENAAAAPQPLHVVVVGAGIGGLTTALFLRRQGHKVTVLEQSGLSNELGAAIQLTPNANGLLRRLGIYAEKIGASPVKSLIVYDQSNMKISGVDYAEESSIWQHPWQSIHRVHLHSELKRQATTSKSEGTPVELKTSSRVAKIDVSSAIVTLENGDKVRGDVVIGADGVHSTTRATIAQEDVKAKFTGKSAFHFLVPRQLVLDDPKTAKYAQNDGEIIVWRGSDRQVVLTPCDANRHLSLFCIAPSPEASTKTENGKSSTPSDAVQKAYEGFDDSLIALIGKIPSATSWQVQDVDKIPTWASHHLTLLGDAAHPFPPHQGQGSACSMEDAAALAVVLQHGVQPKDVPARLKLYETIRKERAQKLQDYSRIANSDPAEQKDLDTTESTNYIFGHDEWDNSTQALRKWTWAQTPNLYWRMPISFGPFPGPRQTFAGRPRNGDDSTFVTASVKFRTSRTLLQNLFPSPSFRFRSPGTCAYASFSQTTLNRMQWLGGTGYRHIGLYIHGVQYVQKNGEVLDGTFLPILFESLTDPIVSGREELGMPKLLCSVDLWRRERSFRIQTGWQGAQFGSIALEDLVEVDKSADKGTIGGEDDQGIFAYKYIPKVGARGQADVEHATFVPHAEEAKTVNTKVQRVYKTQKASVSFDGLDWDALPTLHHVVSRLAEIPIYEIIGGKLVEGTGVPDVSSARRID
ncbi:hypothetical protein F5Y15DRAFT_123771 [Xylariaceae sp. FL0016]|nr:hypothetical protein F5Y15DRAFT_123771 [Xylariaceae sp. FL0016]